MPDGSKRPVKFDGARGEYMVDRKYSVRDQAHGREQLRRQSQVLAEHGLIGTWEVGSEKARKTAMRMLKRQNVRNIKIKVVEP